MATASQLKGLPLILLFVVHQKLVDQSWYARLSSKVLGNFTLVKRLPASGATSFDMLTRVWTDMEFVERVAGKLPADQNRSVLEIGFGAGLEMLALQKSHPLWDLTALDRPEVGKRSKRLLKDCLDKEIGGLPPSSLPLYETELRHHGIQVARHLLPATLPFASGSKDLVFARLSLHYFHEDELTNIFADIHRLLRPDGSLVFMVKTKDNLNKPNGKVLYGPREWACLLRQAGFAHVKDEPDLRPEAIAAGEPWIFEATKLDHEQSLTQTIAGILCNPALARVLQCLDFQLAALIPLPWSPKAPKTLEPLHPCLTLSSR